MNPTPDIGELRKLEAAAHDRANPHRTAAVEEFCIKALAAAPALLAAVEEGERLRETLNKACERSVRLTDIDNKVRAALCNCKSPTDHEDECAALQPLAGIAALKSRLALAEAVVSAARELTKLDPLMMAPVKVCLWYELQGKCALALSTYEGKSE